MIYLKTEYKGTEIKVPIYTDEFFTTCPQCGKEVNVDIQIIKKIRFDFEGTSVYCNKCTERR